MVNIVVATVEAPVVVTKARKANAARMRKKDLGRLRRGAFGQADKRKKEVRKMQRNIRRAEIRKRANIQFDAVRATRRALETSLGKATDVPLV
jgi:hypothetical protein